MDDITRVYPESSNLRVKISNFDNLANCSERETKLKVQYTIHKDDEIIILAFLCNAFTIVPEKLPPNFPWASFILKDPRVEIW